MVSPISILRQCAFEIFVGTTVLNSTLATEFVKGLTVAFVNLWDHPHDSLDLANLDEIYR